MCSPLSYFRYYGPMPESVDWKRLITLLRASYEYGEGGITRDTKLTQQTISRAYKTGKVESQKNATRIWNVAVGRLTYEQMASCDFSNRASTK